MKKILCLFSALTLVLSSCSSDDASSPILIKKIIEKDIDGDNFTVSYTYNGNKISEETGQDGDHTYQITYSYDGDLLTSMTEASGGQVDVITTFTYNANILKTVLVDEVDASQHYITKTSYTHNTDGSVSYEKVDVDNGTKAESNKRTGKLTFTEGNLIKEENVYSSGKSTIVYEYDTKNNPFKNVVGVGLLLDNSELGYSKYNKTKQTTTSSYDNSTMIYTSTFTYDGNDFPTEAKHFDKNGAAEGTTQYFY